MSVCGASHCSKKKQCKKYFRNSKDGTDQYIDWSVYATGSMTTDRNGKSRYKEEWTCGDWSENYPLFEKIIDRKPKDIQEVKDFIYKALEEKYGNAVILDEDSKGITINTQTNNSEDNEIWITFRYMR